jgi:hypothetical protein
VKEAEAEAEAISTERQRGRGKAKRSKNPCVVCLFCVFFFLVESSVLFFYGCQIFVFVYDNILILLLFFVLELRLGKFFIYRYAI